MKLIDADALRDALGITGTNDSCKGCKYNERYGFACNTDSAPTFEYVCEMIDDAPAIEERKKGKWELLDECSNAGYYCSQCHKKVVKEGWSNTVKKINFCPNCGADMREVSQ